jgi:hypothetical protein
MGFLLPARGAWFLSELFGRLLAFADLAVVNHYVMLLSDAINAD